MAVEAPVIVSEKASQFYRFACYLAKQYIPKWENIAKLESEDDPGVVLFKLLAQLAERVAERINRIPEKQLLAFYDFLGVAHQAPVAARVPLSFALASGSEEDVVVPIRTQVATNADSAVVFETVAQLTVVNNAIKAIYSLNPQKDAYTWHMDEAGNIKPDLELFSEEGTPLEHRVYLADPGFEVGAPVDLDLWYHYKSGAELKVNLFNLDQYEFVPTTVNGDTAYWLFLTPKKGLPPLMEKPAIDPELVYRLKAAGILPDTLLVNDGQVDPLKGFYPFGEMPKAGDVFYLGSREVFSKTGACLEVTIAQIAGKPQDKNTIALKWEYLGTDQQWRPLLDGNRQELYYVFDGELKTLHFPCPEIPINQLGGLESRWIRVILAQGCYNTEGVYNTTTCTPPVYTPPFITSLRLKYVAPAQRVQRCKVYNTLAYQDIELERAVSFQPYPALGDYPALFIGLAAEPGQKQLTLYFSLLGDESGATSSTPREVRWFYAKDDSGWSELEVEDETAALTQSGIVKLTVPEKITDRTLFGEKLFWLKAEARAGQWETYRLQGIFLNTVWAENTQRIQDELLGASLGEVDQEFTLAAHPILGAVTLEIQEPSVPTEEELQILTAEEGDTAWRTVKDSEGAILEVWVRWHEVASLIHSTSLNRHYLVDRINGRIRFGDGEHGMIPPMVANNILAREYQSGGGTQGNQPALALTVLKTAVAGIDQVTNYDAATGGRDLETIDDVVVRAPSTIKCFDRAVTAEDFEFLARETTSEVLKAKCYIDGAAIKVVIVPDSDASLPLPSPGLVSQVAASLQEKVFFPIRAQITVCGPDYAQIDVQVGIAADSDAGTDLTLRVQNRLAEYLDPFKGGTAATGWELGQTIFAAEVAAAVKEVTGVLYIETLEIRKNQSGSGNFVTNFLTLNAGQLPCPGAITVEIDGG